MSESLYIHEVTEVSTTVAKIGLLPRLR